MRGQRLESKGVVFASDLCHASSNCEVVIGCARAVPATRLVMGSHARRVRLPSSLCLIPVKRPPRHWLDACCRGLATTCSPYRSKRRNPDVAHLNHAKWRCCGSCGHACRPHDKPAPQTHPEPGTGGCPAGILAGSLYTSVTLYSPKRLRLSISRHFEYFACRFRRINFLKRAGQRPTQMYLERHHGCRACEQSVP